jgi:hypothetical protein
MTRLFYEKYMPEDPLLSSVFANIKPDHPERVATWFAEVFGGPKTYTERYGGPASKRRPPVAPASVPAAPLGLGSGDRFRAFRGGPGSFKDGLPQPEKPPVLQGNRATKRVSQIT